MDAQSTGRRSAARCAMLGAVAALATMVAANAALAGQCPADKRGVDVTKPSTVAAKDVTDKVLASIDLAKEKVALADHQLRVRQLEIQPGGIVPWHSHGDRPALIYIVRGEIYEYASNCAVPILHKAGEVAAETSVTPHWWKNTGTETVVLISADVLHDQTDHNM
jgi:quercetin dioxygenase-like cupin family protein